MRPLLGTPAAWHDRRVRGLVGWAVVLLANASCFTRAANQHHEQRMARNDAAYRSDEAAIQRDYEAALAKLQGVE
jgi:hypothetical protein